jgi:ribosomal protein S18 acetylase RimI-like enzyme
MTSLSLREHARSELHGLRRFEPGRDLSAVVRLLEVGFKNDLEAADYRWLAELEALSTAGPLLTLAMDLVPRAESSFGGFVWYEGGRLVGNVSLMRSTPSVWVIANVVTAPECRRRGIGRQLMAAAIDAVRARGGEQVQLQVRVDNQAAQTLYAGLGFWHMNTAALLRLTDLSAAGAAAVQQGGARVVAGGATLQRWSGAGANSVRHLLQRAGIAERGGPPSLVAQTLAQLGWRGRIDDWMHGRERYGWAAAAVGEYRGVAVAVVNTGIPHRLDVVVEPRWRGYVEMSLVGAALRALARHGPATVEAEIDTAEHGAIAALEAAAFRRIRTLDRLALDVAPRNPAADHRPPAAKAPP